MLTLCAVSLLKPVTRVYDSKDNASTGSTRNNTQLDHNRTDVLYTVINSDLANVQCLIFWL